MVGSGVGITVDGAVVGSGGGSVGKGDVSSVGRIVVFFIVVVFILLMLQTFAGSNLGRAVGKGDLVAPTTSWAGR